MEMETVRVNGDNAEDELWMLTMHLDAGYTGTLWLQARTGDGDWQETGESFPVTVAAIPLPESAEAAPEAAPAVKPQKVSVQPAPAADAPADAAVNSSPRNGLSGLRSSRKVENSYGTLVQ